MSERSSSGMVNFHDGDFDEEILAYTDLYWLNFDRPPKWVLYAMGLFIANLCLVAIVVIHSTWKNSSLSNPWVTNVRISSVLFCVTNAFSIASCFNGIWMFGHTGCQLYALAQGYFALVTFMSLVGGVANLPDKKSSSVASQIIWIYTLVILLPPFFGWGHYHLSGYLVTCCFEHAVADWNNKSYVWFLYWTGFVSPLAFLLKNGVNQAGSLEATMLRKALGSYLVLWMPYAIMGFAGVTFPQSFTITPTMESLVTTFSKIFVLCLPLAEIHTLQKMRKVQ